MLKYKDKKWYQLWGPCRESADLPMKTADPSSLLRFFLLFLYLSLSVMSRDCTRALHYVTRHYLELRSCRKTEETGGEGTDRRSASGRDFLPFSVAVVFPLLILSWERRLITGAAPVLYLHPPRCHFHCHSDWRFKNEMGQRDIELTKEGLTSAALPSLMLLIICH